MSAVSATIRNPATAAAELLGSGFSARVLEPSPPAVVEEPFFADDPAAAGTPDSPDDNVVTPTSAGDRSWDDIVADRPDLADFARENWLGNRARLMPVPSGYRAGREAFHRLAYSVVAEARRLHNGKFGLRYTHGGFGTPFFGDDTQIRVDRNLIIAQTADQTRSSEISTLRGAADFVGVEPGTEAGEQDSPVLGDVDAPLAVTAEVGAFLGNWFGFAWAVLEELRLTDGAANVDRTQLWPGHFDPAIGMGDAGAGHRATYGLSPGDDTTDDPYLYVGAWGDVDRDDPFWNGDDFNGATLPFVELVATDDSYETALEFFRGGYRRLIA